jgi:hypothetical protein
VTCELWRLLQRVEGAISAPGHWRRLWQRSGWPTVVFGLWRHCGGSGEAAMVEMVAMAMIFDF